MIKNPTNKERITEIHGKFGYELYLKHQRLILQYRINDKFSLKRI